jgi:hypothetical protein
MMCLSLQFLLTFASAVILWSESRCLRFEAAPTWRARSPYLYTPGTGSLFVDSYDSLAYNIGTDHEETLRFHCYSPAIALLSICFLARGTCLPSRCPETGLIYPPISRPLHSKDSTRYNIFPVTGIEPRLPACPALVMVWARWIQSIWMWHCIPVRSSALKWSLFSLLYTPIISLMSAYHLPQHSLILLP